ncbi:hypothetical protein [Candidatus Deianiraea vastatrix]|uniref:Uncharacterized protein n=1 Tax=Candidatus Deianiraea vastatrix TaxID=2163644 RepID=A0A5B8XBX5_9RICK|nr:hypothetical protein [Candidatus Deianiraea vastatrix]QED22853.1 hypothetical protein Deia_00039 [Candidatus Deianiraea vastatrix]
MSDKTKENSKAEGEKGKKSEGFTGFLETMFMGKTVRHGFLFYFVVFITMLQHLH